jgi:hypothetical protein
MHQVRGVKQQSINAFLMPISFCLKPVFRRLTSGLTSGRLTPFLKGPFTEERAGSFFVSFFCALPFRVSRSQESCDSHSSKGGLRWERSYMWETLPTRW